QVAISQADGPVSSIRLLPDGGAPNRAAVDAIRRADQVVLAPGSLYTSLVAALLAPGIVDAVNHTRAAVVWVLNLCTQRNETIGMTGLEHLAALEALAGL